MKDDSMIEENDFIEIGFRYVDQFGNEVKADKKLLVELADTTPYGLLAEFKDFLIYAGYPQLVGKEIDFIDDEDDNYK